jgi:hypothetical protein
MKTGGGPRRRTLGGNGQIGTVCILRNERCVHRRSGTKSQRGNPWGAIVNFGPTRALLRIIDREPKAAFRALTR